MTDPTLAAHDILLILSPPIRLIDWLERVWADKAAKGEKPPENFVKWLDRWKQIRSDLPSEIDCISEAEWAEIAKAVNGADQRPPFLDGGTRRVMSEVNA